MKTLLTSNLLIYTHFFNHDINKFILQLQKRVSNLNIEDITASDYMHTKRDWKDVKIKNLDDYHDLYVQSNTLAVLADVFGNFRNMDLKVCKPWPCSFYFCTRISMTSSLTKDQSKITMINWYWYFTNDRKRC